MHDPATTTEAMELFNDPTEWAAHAPPAGDTTRDHLEREMLDLVLAMVDGYQQLYQQVADLRQSQEAQQREIDRLEAAMEVH